MGFHRMRLTPVFAFIIALAGITRAAPAQMEGVRVAVVDVERVFNEMDERSDILANIQSQIQELQQWEQSQRESLQELQADLELLKPESEEYLKTREELRSKAVALRVQMEVKQQQLEAEQAAQMEMLYRKILDAVSRVARDEDVQLVLTKDNTPRIRNANQQQIAAMVQARKVLFAHSDLDMTESVKRKLNSEYELSSGN